MLRTLSNIFKLCFYGLIILAGVTFAVSNRGTVELTFYPMPYAVTLPLFVFATAIFFIGLVTGWFIRYTNSFRYRREHKQAVKRIAALENELGALRSEQTLKAAVTLSPK